MNEVQRMQAAVAATLPDAVDLIGDVATFHTKFGQNYTGKPRMLPSDLFSFRSKFHREEIQEYEDEQLVLENIVGLRDVGANLEDHVVQALENQLDALVDAAWVILGTAEQQFGVERFREAWRRVVTANMSKVLHSDGVVGSIDSGREHKQFDIVKPPGWKAPDHKDLVRDHEPLPETI